jgi:hypothetical protein
MQIKVLFLDDNTERHKHFIQNNSGLIIDQVYDADMCIKCLDYGEYDIVFLDHDLNDLTNNELNDDEKDGRYVVSKMITPTMIDKYKNKLIVIHSLNSAGAESMKSMLIQYGYNHVVRVPFVWMSDVRKSLNNWI